MQDKKSVNAWLAYHSYKWVNGQERLYKAQLTWFEAQALIEELQAEGAIEAC